MKSFALPLAQTLFRGFYLKVYDYPLLTGIFFSVVSQIYLIADFSTINHSALLPLWQIENNQPAPSLGIMGEMLAFLHHMLAVDAVTAAYILIIIVHAVIVALMLLIARCLNFSLITRWCLLFIVLFNASYNDFRCYIITEPLFWVFWLAAIYLLLLLHRKHTVWAVLSWLSVFLLASQLSVVAWFWLLLFPFGALLWKPWRRKSIGYTLLAYAVIIVILIFLPLHNGTSPIEWFTETLFDTPSRLSAVMSLNNNNWVREDDHFMMAVLVISGALSLVVMRLVITIGVGCVFLVAYAVAKKQYRMIDGNVLRIIVYAIFFDVLISVVFLIVAEDTNTVLSFSTALLLMFFSALGLSYVIKKLFVSGYSRLTVLVIVWCFVAYVASGYIIFGARKSYQKDAGEAFLQTYGNATVYSNNSPFLFHAGKNPTLRQSLPETTLSSGAFDRLGDRFYYAYDKFRSHELPPLLAAKKPLVKFSNPRSDTLFIFYFDRDKDITGENVQQNLNEN